MDPAAAGWSGWSAARAAGVYLRCSGPSSRWCEISPKLHDPAVPKLPEKAPGTTKVDDGADTSLAYYSSFSRRACATKCATVRLTFALEDAKSHLVQTDKDHRFGDVFSGLPSKRWTHDSQPVLDPRHDSDEQNPLSFRIVSK